MEQGEKRINVAFVLDAGGIQRQISMAEARAIAQQLPPANQGEQAGEQAMAPIEPEPTSSELFDGNISKLGRVVHDLPFDEQSG